MFIAAEKGGDSREVLQSEKYHANIINVRGLRPWNDRVLDIQDIKWIISLSVKCFYNVFFQNIFLWSSEIVFLICSGQEIQRQQTIWRDKGRELLEKINILFWQETHLLLLDYLDIKINVDISEICQLLFLTEQRTRWVRFVRGYRLQNFVIKRKILLKVLLLWQQEYHILWLKSFIRKKRNKKPPRLAPYIFFKVTKTRGKNEGKLIRI